MESRTILITLGVLAGLTILFQGASSATSLSSRGGGACNDAEHCCAAHNCHVINCNNSDQGNLAVLSGISAADCTDIANELKAALLIGIVADLADIANAGPCGSTLLNDIIVGVLGSSKNVQCCNGDVHNGFLGGGGRGGDSSNCNKIANKCTAACGHQGSRSVFQGKEVFNQCESNCCTLQTC